MLTPEFVELYAFGFIQYLQSIKPKARMQIVIGFDPGHGGIVDGEYQIRKKGSKQYKYDDFTFLQEISESTSVDARELVQRLRERRLLKRCYEKDMKDIVLRRGRGLCYGLCYYSRKTNKYKTSFIYLFKSLQYGFSLKFFTELFACLIRCVLREKA